MIKVYTTPTCIYCHALMNWLNEEGISYQENKNPVQIIGFDRDVISETIARYDLRKNS